MSIVLSSDDEDVVAFNPRRRRTTFHNKKLQISSSKSSSSTSSSVQIIESDKEAENPEPPQSEDEQQQQQQQPTFQPSADFKVTDLLQHLWNDFDRFQTVRAGRFRVNPFMIGAWGLQIPTRGVKFNESLPEAGDRLVKFLHTGKLEIAGSQQFVDDMVALFRDHYVPVGVLAMYTWQYLTAQRLTQKHHVYQTSQGYMGLEYFELVSRIVEFLIKKYDYPKGKILDEDFFFAGLINAVLQDPGDGKAAMDQLRLFSLQESSKRKCLFSSAIDNGHYHRALFYDMMTDAKQRGALFHVFTYAIDYDTGFDHTLNSGEKVSDSLLKIWGNLQDLTDLRYSGETIRALKKLMLGLDLPPSVTLTTELITAVNNMETDAPLLMLFGKNCNNLSSILHQMCRPEQVDPVITRFVMNHFFLLQSTPELKPDDVMTFCQFAKFLFTPEHLATASIEQMRQILFQDNLQVYPEIKVFETVLEWCGGDTVKLDAVKLFIRFPTMSDQELEQVLAANILTEQEALALVEKVNIFRRHAQLNSNNANDLTSRIVPAN